VYVHRISRDFLGRESLHTHTRTPRCVERFESLFSRSEKFTRRDLLYLNARACVVPRRIRCTPCARVCFPFPSFPKYVKVSKLITQLYKYTYYRRRFRNIRLNVPVRIYAYSYIHTRENIKRQNVRIRILVYVRYIVRDDKYEYSKRAD